MGSHDSPASDAPASETGRQVDAVPPRTIGRYRLLDVLGKGGMGVVYLAEQTEPIQRRVALKLIKQGMDTREVISRFESERQALALMDHPNIARVFDGGATESGRPYFVMELVRGVAITEYADAHRLSTAERLRLFLDVCAAVQHAHLKGVIHRDLKPSNVLVTVQDGTRVVKVIDFGIAKAVGRPLGESWPVTRIGQMVGTPEYMSPEQAEMSGLDVDTRTDIYSLGVILYELLIGILPFDLAARSPNIVPHVLREREPLRPSARFTSAGEAGTEVAERRRTTPWSLRRELRRDLDWIILRAMDKDRIRRYETAHALALDIERHLNSEPVLARPPSMVYRTGRFVRRHRGGVAAATIATIAIVTGAGAASAGFLHAREAQARAEREGQASKTVADFLVNLFRVSDPGETRGNTITARELLDSGAVRIHALAGVPLIESRLMRTIGAVYAGLGLYSAAHPMLEQAVALEEQRSDGDGLQLMDALLHLGQLEREEGNYTSAEAHLKRALELGRGVLGARDTLVGTAMNSLGGLYEISGRYTEAEPLLQEALRIYQQAVEPAGASTATVLNNLFVLYWRMGDYARARSYLEQSLSLREKLLSPDDPQLATGYNNLGALYFSEHRYADAQRAYERARRIWEAALGPEHPRIANVLNNLAEVAWAQKRYEEATRDFQRSLAIKEKLLSPGDPSLAVTMNGLANVYRDEGRFDDAETLYRRALSIRERSLGPDDRLIAETLEDYAELMRRSGRDDAAASLVERAAAIRAKLPVG